MTVLRAFKASNENKSLDDTTTNDTDLFVAVPASTTYSVKALLIFSSASSIDARLRLNAPSGSIVHTSGFYVDGLDEFGWHDDTHSGDILAITASTAGTSCWLTGYVRTIGNSGTVGIGWAQSNTNVVATTLEAGSWLKVTQIS